MVYQKTTRIPVTCSWSCSIPKAVTKPLVKEYIPTSCRPVTCILADGILGFICDVANEIGIPIFYCRTMSAFFLSFSFCLPKLIESGELPFKGDDLYTPITSVPGMEGFLRRRDLPTFCRCGDLSDPSIQLFKTEIQELPRAHGLILNTMEHLEGPVLSHIREHCPNLYTIGLVHAQLKSKLAGTTTSSSTSSSKVYGKKTGAASRGWTHNRPNL
ncbi:hypothetical protein RJ639_023555 [Escallonia herrerae]|uniref:Uncharacterized protein n=1 Tax=Escallonia herrerae TaxID=1293975 RepID=A0AA89AF20_9ASTE|nr:hypothetical protein RJ639_023555 [Escallonia herrerae]